MSSEVVPSSFRDPSGFLFRRDGILLRQINPSYREEYELLRSSGLYDRLVEMDLLIPHTEIDEAGATETAYKVIQPEIVPFISYPYEWSFSQLQDAALATLRLQREALERGMVLKDASAYNIQFRRGRPLLIDTLSFARYHEGEPWVAYRQFCQHFLAPLALMAHRDVRLSQLLRVHLDGIPLDLAARTLPWRTRLQPGLLMHIHAHAASQKRHQSRGASQRRARVGRDALRGIVGSLEGAIAKLRWRPSGTAWADYYSETNYSDAALEEKRKLVGFFLDAAQPRGVWDLGANTGLFSREASRRGIPTIAIDADPAAVELHYLDVRKRGDGNILPLCIDLTNPSSSSGWEHEERDSLLARGPADCVLALALVHHLAIGNNVPLPKLATFFARTCRSLIIEFVPKEDSQVERMLATREDVFPDYRQDVFEASLAPHFTLVAAEKVPGTARTLFHMRAASYPEA
jgi:ribosomal protein L11 methylase PrmA